MWGQYEWLVWLLFGGLFLFLMFRGGGCCGGHGGHGGHGGNDSGRREEPDAKTTDGTPPPKKAHTACH
jgi:hypothetical protein